ncbi:SDR family oxidoreductase [Fibrella aquatilis]|uniref:SDR family oxidoreductase n=1 Tax=Fibrella aquatilis TaxID=2817059 RepID=A0A939JYQ7_9BACT|nr:SDR family oxidoreductase [Fibrella aquatilis]MBO0929395.1 SDR family oxidoreductase [Fibrella aquatilis]
MSIASSSRTVAITGTSSGIGRAAVKAFSDNGWRVAATLRNPARETDMQNWPGVSLYPLDVTDTTSIDTALQAILADFGQVNVLVNNAGYGVDGVFEAMTDEIIERQFNTNVFGLMRMTRALIPHMRQRGGGTIIQIASMGGQLAFPLFSIYHGTKWAVEGFTESLQYELNPFNIRLKLIEPGAIKTEFYGAGREMVKPMGTAAYDAFVAKCDKVNQESGAQGESAELVAAAIYKAATDGSRKLRYPVGAPAPLLLRLRKLLPDSLWFGVVKSSYKL